MKKLVLSLLAVFILFPAPARAASWPQNVTKDDITYLRKVMKETWRYIDSFIAPETGIPYDSNQGKDITNTTNIGLYLASLCMAHKLGYVPEEQAVARIQKILDSLDTYEHWNRLYGNWLDPSGKDRKAKPGESNISDYNKLPAGLIVVRQTFPQLADRCTAFLDEIPWEAFYEPETGKIRYAFDVGAREARTPVFFSRGEDKILGHFLMIASGKVPASSWDKHALDTEERHGIRYLQPGWQGGGLFMQYICGLFLDSRGTSLGRSAANFAWAQIVHAQKIGAPVWGWSACVAPNGAYLGMGLTRDEIVTPHASALAVHLFAREVVDNLKRLDALGLAAPQTATGSVEWYGFRDAVNWKTGEITDKYLILDQAMLFLSLVNFCENGLLWKTFGADEMVARGRGLIKEYAEAGQHRAEETRYIASLSFEDPGTFWLSPRAQQRCRPGEIVHRTLWARSLSARKLSGSSVRWRVVNADGEAVAAGVEQIELPPRESRRLADVRIPTADAKYGTAWTIECETRAADQVVLAQVEGIPFPGYRDLAGLWRIQPGDDATWSDPKFDDSDWLETRVPGRWEDGALPEYDGMAWYRLRFKIEPAEFARWTNQPLAVALGAVDDADETFLNGQKIGSAGKFPPDEETAYNAPRIYEFDAALLQADNVLAVRVSDWKGNGGIWRGPVAVGPAGELFEAAELAK